jgi:small-conductance mechanosensitive channel
MLELTEGYKDLVLVLSVPGLYCFFVLLGRRLKRRHGVHLGLFYHLFSLAVALYLPALILGEQWAFMKHLGAAVIVLSSSFLIALVERFVWDVHFRQHQHVDVPKFLTELARILILMVAVFVVLQFVYNQSVKGLLIAPGIAAVVLGFAMQDLFGNIIAGVSLQISKSFTHGEWLLIENRYAEVIEINWRSTRLRTNDDISIEVPNREIARQTIVNLNRPLRQAAMRMTINVDYASPPTRVKDVLLHATCHARGVLAAPAPKVFLKNFAESGIDYEIKFWLENYSMYNDVCDSIRTNIWYALRRHGIGIPYPTQTLLLERPGRKPQADVASAARLILRQQPLFQCLNDDQLDALMPGGRVVHFGRGEKVIRQGESGDSMFILVEGEANVIIDRNGTQKNVASLASGDCFGEMSLLTGESRSATVAAKTDCLVFEIGKAVLARSLREYPELLTKLSELLARRQMNTEGVLASEARTSVVDPRQTKYAASFLNKLQAFFEL